MIDAGMSDALSELDDARRAARAALEGKPPATDPVATIKAHRDAAAIKGDTRAVIALNGVLLALGHGGEG